MDCAVIDGMNLHGPMRASVLAIGASEATMLVFELSNLFLFDKGFPMAVIDTFGAMFRALQRGVFNGFSLSAAPTNGSLCVVPTFFGTDIRMDG